MYTCVGGMPDGSIIAMLNFHFSEANDQKITFFVESAAISESLLDGNDENVR
jgi:hypothetical protein